MSDTTVTPYQLLAQVRAFTGHEIRLRPYDVVRKITVDRESGTAAVLLLRHTVTEKSREDVLTSQSTVLIVVRRGTREWEVTELPNPDWTPTIHKRFDFLTQAERLAKREWEADCGRPGRSRYGAPIQAERERNYFTSSS
jgi:hypothetical protein